jgi:sugar phosphate isomerase/epimerase
MKLAFMSSVCPPMKLAELLEAGQKHGYEAIEFRPEWRHGHGVELEASADQRREIAGTIADSGLAACCISPGVRFCHADAAARDADYEKLLRYIKLAADVRIPVIRVFGDPLPNDGGRARSYGVQADYLARAAERARAAGVTVALETHTNLRGFDAGEILFQAGYPDGLAVNWHLSHCLRHGEDVVEAYRHIKGRVAHVHFSVGDDEKNPQYLRRQMELLAGEGYGGCWSVEVINPPESEPVLQSHAAWWKQVRSI